jgi:hypothetical protein
MVTGLRNHMVDVTAPPPLRARIRVGERVILTQHCVGCVAAPVSYSWTSTNPGVASFAPIEGGTSSFMIYLVGVSPGETNVYVDLTFLASTGLAPYRANLAHCTTVSLSQCNSPQRIAPVEVVAQ